jgi:hypothetical protein
MPAGELEWKTYRIPARAGAASRAVEAVAATDEELTVEIPALSEWPEPRDKAKILLETAAEVEHSLLVQYLYAAFSLKNDAEVSDPDQQSALNEWFFMLHRTARDEMGHLMTAQNLLLAVGLQPNLEREDFPSRTNLYPFELHLEPLSQRSLAKYVTAEAPQDASGIDDIVALATESAGTTVNRVGVIWGLLGVVFSTAQQVAAGGSDSRSWDDMLRRLAAAAYQQSTATSWHLGDQAIDPHTLDFQAHMDSWPGGGVTIHRIGDRAAALQAIRDIAVLGAGPTDGGEASHYDRYRRMYRGSNGIMPFPPADAWNPTRAIPTDPRPDAIVEPPTRRWAQLADLRYALLLGFIEHHLLTSEADDRANLARWAIDEMFMLSALTAKLATLPQESGVAALPFSLPTLLHLPAAESERWQLQRVRTAAAITHVQQMRAADPADADNDDLAGLLETDTARLKLMHGDGPAPVPTTSFARDVLPLFRPIDIEHMNDQVVMDLTDFDVVRSSAASISKRLRGIGGRRMPPPPHPPLTPAQIELFDAWIADGCPP